MDQLDFLTAIVQEPETKYIAKVLHDKYKQFHADGNYGVAMTETMFGRKIQEIDGVTRQKTNHGSVYHMNKEAMKNHLEVLSLDMRKITSADSQKRKEIEERKRKHNLETEEEQRKAKRLQDDEEDRQRKIIEEQEEKCRKVMVEYAHGDNLTRLTIEPSLHRMLESRYPDENKRSEFIKSLAAAVAKPSMEYAGVYVLKLGGLPHMYYVGCSKTVLARIEQHRRGAGAACTAGATSIEVLPLLTEGNEADLDGWERAETLTLMYTFGIDKVRGWH